MAFTVSIARFPQFVQLAVSGPTSVSDFIELITTLEQETMDGPDRRALVDLRSVVGRLTTAEHIFLGELIAQNLRHLDRIAAVVLSEEIPRNSETAAQQLGVFFRIFTAREKAVAWLMADPIRATRKIEQATASARFA
jgi:SpoIIAA-like